MSVADQIQDHRARCRALLVSLRMLARDEGGAPFPCGAVARITETTSAVLAEAEAAGRIALNAAGADGHNPGDGTFLQVRLNRLAAAADDAVTAALAGNFGEMRRHLHRFDALTSAIWTVQDAVYGPVRGASSGHASRKPAA
jgi:hypothetical protein